MQNNTSDSERFPLPSSNSFKYDKVNLEDPRVWSLFHQGRCQGVFQLETDLSTYWCSRLKPSSIEELSDVISLVRPGPLESEETERYAKRKEGKEKVTYEHPILEPILKGTQGIICIQKDSKVSLSSGKTLAISDVSIGQEILSYDENSKKIVSKKCISKDKSNQSSGVKITLKNGYEIITTLDHKIQTWKGMKEARLLDIDKDSIAISNYGIDNNTGQFEKECLPLGDPNNLAYLIGYIIGDGSIGSSVVLCIHKEDDANKMMDWISKELPSFNTTKHFNCRCWYIILSHSIKLNDKRYNHRKTKWSYLIDVLDMRQKAYTKYIPDMIMESSKDIKASLLAGLMDSDGCIQQNDKGISFCYYSSVSNRLLDCVKRLLQDFGITHQVYYQYHRIQIYNTKRLQEIIGRKLLYKKFTGQITDGNHHGDIPISEIFNYRKNNNLTEREFHRKTGIARRIFRTKNHFITPYLADKIGVTEGDCKYFRIKKVEMIENEEFYDIGIEDTHNFVANGIIVHNCYQESCSKIAGEIAGFSEAKQEELRKCLAKKKPELIQQIKKEFLEGVEQIKKVPIEIGKEIFNKIEKFQRYGFCKAHGIEYSYLSYYSAACKVYYPTEFYTAWLSFSGDKIDPKEEIKKLVDDANRHNIKIIPPEIARGNIDFQIIKEGLICFGLSSIRGIADKAAKNILDNLDQLQTFSGFLKSLKSIHRGVAESLVKSGACDLYKLPRNYLLKVIHVISGRSNNEKDEENAVYRKLTENEYKQFLLGLDQGVQDALQSILDKKACVTKRREIIERKIKLLDEVVEDTFRQKSLWESLYLGVALTCSAADDFEKLEKSTPCKDIFKLNNKSKVVLHVVIDDISKHRTKDTAKTPNAEYARLTVSDNTGSATVMLWPEMYNLYKEEIAEGAVVAIFGRIDLWQMRRQISVDKIVLIG